MKPKKQPSKPAQQDLFRIELDRIVDLNHPLVKLSAQMDWQGLEEHFGTCFCDAGRPAINTRLMISLHYLKYANNLSDEETVALWVENPYWQYFGGMVYFEHKLPIHPSSMCRWRKRIGEYGAEKLLKQTIEQAVKSKLVKPSQLTKINVDTTVSLSNIAFPTDARLYKRAIDLLRKIAKKENIALRQSYVRVSQEALIKSQRYSHACQMKRAGKQVKRLHGMLGCLIRDIKRKIVNGVNSRLDNILEKSTRILNQKRNDKNKIYSIHEPDVQCISKGKVGRKYEFGHKISLAVTTMGNWVVASLGLKGNPYDGHTLKATIEKVEENTGKRVKEVFVDRGYRKHGCDEDVVMVDRERRGKLSKTIWKKLKHRSAIEPVIGHLKSDCRLERNYLQGEEGNAINAVLSAAGYNFRKLLKAISLFFEFILYMLQNKFYSSEVRS